jgi:parallel beta-helix repeat protein
MKTSFTKSMMMAALFVIICVVANATTRYLPANNTADQTAAFQTLVNQSVTGDIIVIRAGNHRLNGTVNVNKNGITIRGENGNVFIKTGNVSFIDINGDNNRIENLYLDGYNRPEPCMRVFRHYNLILNCTFRNSGNSGILIHNCHHNTIQGCKAFYNYMVGISQWGHSDGTVRDCQMYENGAEGLTIDGATHNNRVFGNWIHLNNLPHRGVGGIGIDDADGAWIYNNTIDFNGFSGITFQNNLCCGSDGSRIFNNANISYNQACAVMIRTTQPVTNLQFTGNNCVGNPGGLMCYTGARMNTHDDIVMADVEEQTSLAYPNPVKDVIHIPHTENIQRILLLNSLGQQIYSEAPGTRKEVTVDASTFIRGMYLLKLERVDSPMTIQKIFKD